MSWDDNCKTLLLSYPALDNLCISNLDGVIYGTTNRKTFLLSSDIMHKIIDRIQGKSDTTSFEINSSRFIILRVDKKLIIAKAGKVTLFCAITGKLLLVGLSEDTDSQMKSGSGNDAIYKLQEYYINAGF